MQIINLLGKAEHQAKQPVRDSRYQPPRLIEPPVPRPGIMQRMADADGLVVLLAGPPGCGKTMALAMHYGERTSCGARTAWLTLTPADNDPDTLRRHLHQAFAPDCRPDEELGSLHANMLGFLDGLDNLTNPVAYELVERFILGVTGGSIFHVTAKRLHGSLLYDGLLRGAVRVIGPEKMRLDNSEAAAILGDGWETADVEQLNQSVDGWAAGLRFLARAPETARHFLKTRNGEMTPPAEMADYFDDVICATMKPAVLSVLTEFSVIERFPHELISDMPGHPSSWSVLEAEIRSGSFVRYADETRSWINFHPAFGHHLRQRLQRHSPARYNELRQFAAVWFEKNGYPAEAVRHAITLTERPVAARIIENAGAINVDLDNGSEVGMGATVPPEGAGELPLVFMARIYYLIRHGKQREARKFFDEARRSTQDFTQLHADADPLVIRGWANMMSVLFHTIEDIPISEAQIATLEADIRTHLGTQPILAAGIASVLAFVYLDLSRHADSIAICNIGLHAQHGSNSNKVTIFLRLHQASNAIARDTIEKAVLCTEDAQRLASIESSEGSYEVLTSQMMRAVLHYENNELEAARQLLTPALEQIRTINGWVRLYSEAYTIGTALAGILEGFEQAETVIRAGEAFAYERQLPRLTRQLAILRLRESIRAGEWRHAMTMIETAPLKPLLASKSLSPMDLSQQIPALLEAARLMVELGRPGDANMRLEQVNKAFLNEADNRLLLTFHIIAMRSAYGLRRYNAAVEHMQAAIGIARHAGFVRRVLEEREHITEVFDWSQRNGRSLPTNISAYIEDVLRKADGTENGTILEQKSRRRSPESASNNFVLSPRESEIIALMAEGYINKEIAARLGISEGTVKTHRKNIHEKLGVSSRSQAIMRARDLLLI